MLEAVLPQFASLRKLWVNEGYSGPEFSAWVREHAPRVVAEVIKRTDDVHGSHVLPKRWVVERTFGWVMNHRRLMRDYERTESSAGGWLFVALIGIILGRLT